jgi:uncharacterized RDD family membrane protein YckC
VKPDEANPYAPPAQPDAPTPERAEPIAFALASYGQRFLGASVDAACVVALFFAVHGAVLGANSPFADQPFWHQTIGVALAVCIQGALIATRGQSLGKLVTRTRIVDENGAQARFARAFVAHGLLFPALYMAPSVAYMIGGAALDDMVQPFVLAALVVDGAVIFAGKHRQCLHDRIAGTFVARVGTEQCALPRRATDDAARPRGPTRPT